MKWSYTIANDPSIDFNLVIELEYCGKDVGVIRPGKDGLELSWYSNLPTCPIPAQWLLDVLRIAEESICPKYDETD